MVNKFRESSTFKLVFVSYCVVNYKFLTTSGISLTEYATATAAILAIWLGREWKTAHYDKGDK